MEHQKQIYFTPVDKEKREYLEDNPVDIFGYFCTKIHIESLW